MSGNRERRTGIQVDLEVSSVKQNPQLCLQPFMFAEECCRGVIRV